MPGSLLGGQSAAAGIAIISTIGGSAGMVAPVAVGAIKAATGGFTLSLYLLSFALVIAAVILMAFFRPGRAFSGARNLSEAR
jgi:nitrate/nitrite transporter NarK